MRKGFSLLLTVLFVLALGVSFFHYHEGEVGSHTDCTLCLLLIQPVAACNIENDACCVLSALSMNPHASAGSLASLCFRAAQLSRAPPCPFN